MPGSAYLMMISFTNEIKRNEVPRRVGRGCGVLGSNYGRDISRRIISRQKSGRDGSGSGSGWPPRLFDKSGLGSGWPPRLISPILVLEWKTYLTIGQLRQLVLNCFQTDNLKTSPKAVVLWLRWASCWIFSTFINHGFALNSYYSSMG